jgi:hypothetical protein
MPLTLDKLFSETLESEFEFLGEIVHITWAPARYTGEMDDFAEKLTDEESRERAELEELIAAGQVEPAEKLRQRMERQDKRNLRRILSQLIVSWDLMDGTAPFPTDEMSLSKLPATFLSLTFLAIAADNQPDPQKAPGSDEPSDPKESSAPSLNGTASSGELTTSGSPRGT